MLFSCERSAPHELLRALREWAQSAVGSCRVERWHEGNVLFNFNVNVQATVSQCAVYNPAQTPHVSVPCVQVGADVFSAGMNIIPAPGLRFEVDLNSLQAITETPGEECAVFPHNGGLRLNCVDVGGTKFWAELGLVPGVPGIEFDLSSADVK